MDLLISLPEGKSYIPWYPHDILINPQFCSEIEAKSCLQHRAASPQLSAANAQRVGESVEPQQLL